MPFRILAGLICVMAASLFVLDPTGMAAWFFQDTFNLVAFLVVIPVFAYACLFGKLPDALTRGLSEEMYDDLRQADRLFTEFNAKSIAAAVVALLIIMYVTFR